MAKKNCKADGGAVAKKRGGALNFDNVKAKGSVKKAGGGATSSPFSSAGGGKASTSPFSSAHKG
jgi:hypothetical protein